MSNDSMPDDLYSLDGADNTAYYPDEPEEQKASQQDEDNILAASYPVIGAVKEWFEIEIAAAGSIDNISIDVITVNGVGYERKISVEAQVLANQIVKNKLTGLAQKWEEFEPKEDR